MSLSFRVLVISDRSIMGPDPIGRVLELARGRTRGWALQWREKSASPREVYRDLLALKTELARETAAGWQRVESLKLSRAANEARVDQPGETDAGEPGKTEVPNAPGEADAASSGVSDVSEDYDRPALFVNDRADLALALQLNVHLTESSLPTRVVRALLPSGSLVGRSVHALDRAILAAQEGADYVLFGPIFDTPSKRSFGPPQGLTALREMVAGVPIPVLAVGGIDANRAAECIDAGAAGVAVIRSVWEDADPLRALERILLATGSLNRTSFPGGKLGPNTPDKRTC